MVEFGSNGEKRGNYNQEILLHVINHAWMGRKSF